MFAVLVLAGAVRSHAQTASQNYFYDRNDRLVGVEYDRGVSLAYVYDGNGNLVRQNWLSRAFETNGLPVLWRFLNGLNPTNNSGPNDLYADPDGDGWSNYQEWKANSSPTNLASVPDILGLAGTQIASMTWPFAVSNFTVGVGQLDGAGPEEIVIGADGNPGTNTNFLLVLKQAGAGWQTQRVDVGTLGITSIAIGQLSNRPTVGIYIGLRNAAGPGRVAEITQTGPNWTMSTLTWSTNNAAFVIGVRSRNDLIVTLAPTNAPDGGTFRLAFGTNWSLSLMETNTSHRGLGILGPFAQSGANRPSLRLLDAGGISLGSLRTVTNAVFYPASDKWYLRTLNLSSWTAARAYARTNGGDLATVTDASLNSFLFNQLVLAAPSRNCWIGLFRNDCYSAWQWSSGSPVGFTNWFAGQPDCGGTHGSTERFAHVGSTGQWNDAPDSFDQTAIIEISAQGFETVFWPGITLPEPVASNRINWRGHSLASGSLRGANGPSIFYTFADDNNANGVIDFADDFVTAEYLVSGTNASLLTLSRQPIATLTLAQSYGLASVNFLNRSNEVFFTGEPDGQVFAWTATGVTNPLQRQLFSAHHAGKTWHALSGVEIPTRGEGLAGLRVDPAAPNVCDVIFWSPQRELWNPFIVPQTAPAASILPQPNQGTSLALVRVTLCDAEGNNALPFLQYSNAAALGWSNATLVRIDNTNLAALPKGVAAPPSGATHDLLWNAAADLGSVSTNVLLRARAQDQASTNLFGVWSDSMPYQLTGCSDCDGNGLPDWWEVQFFTTNGVNPSADPDGDGFTNLQEYLADTNPLDAESYLRVTGFTYTPTNIVIEWRGGIQATQYLQRLDDLATNNWENIFTNYLPTPIIGSYTDTNAPGTNAMLFYRIKATR